MSKNAKTAKTELSSEYPLGTLRQWSRVFYLLTPAGREEVTEMVCEADTETAIDYIQSCFSNPEKYLGTKTVDNYARYAALKRHAIEAGVPEEDIVKAVNSACVKNSKRSDAERRRLIGRYLPIPGADEPVKAKAKGKKAKGKKAKVAAFAASAPVSPKASAPSLAALVEDLKATGFYSDDEIKAILDAELKKRLK